MILSWVDRWLSTRRARELLTAFILFASLGFQYLNVTFNPGLQGRHHHATTHLPLLLKIFHNILLPISSFLPPGLTATSIASFTQARYVTALATLLGLIAFTALFFAIYALRMQREFRGENLSEVSTQTPVTRTIATHAPSQHPATIAPVNKRTFGLSSTITACLQKEFIYLIRNTNQLFGFVAPIFMVFLFANRIGGSGRFGDFVFPASVAYSILGVSVLSYNCLGMDGAGIQFYFLAPTRLRDVFLAKNLIGFLLSLVEFVLIFAVISFVSRTPSPLIALATLCWLLFATFTNGAVGNLRSLIAPKKIDLSKVSRKQTSQLSALIALGIVLICFAIGYGGVTLAARLNRPWLMVPIFLALALAALFFYLQVLNRLDSVALNHRETLSEELCKA
jgi:ABC-2 type transport system permease protein